MPVKRKLKKRRKGVPCIPVKTAVKIGHSVQKNNRLTGKQAKKLQDTIFARSCPITTFSGRKRKLSRQEYNTRVRLLRRPPGYS